MRQLLDLRRGHFYALVIAAFFGAIQFSRLIPLRSEALVLYVISCGLLGIVCLFLLSWLIGNFGRLFGVEAIQREVRTALALGILPWALIFAVLSLLLYWGFSPESIIADYFPVFLGAFIYGFYILLFSLKAALRVGVITTFLCLIITIVLNIFPLVLLVQFLSRYIS